MFDVNVIWAGGVVSFGLFDGLCCVLVGDINLSCVEFSCIPNCCSACGHVLCVTAFVNCLL